MASVAKLLGFGLRQVVNDPADRVGQTVLRYLGEGGASPLLNALNTAADRAWQAMGIALAGQPLVEQVKPLLTPRENVAVVSQLEGFIAAQSSAFVAEGDSFRQKCLAELKEARQQGLLSAQKITGEELAQQTAAFQRVIDPASLVEASWQATASMAKDLLGDKYAGLSKILSEPAGGGAPLLVEAFAYFFRREVEINDELCNNLMFDGLRLLTVTHARALSDLGRAMAALGNRLDQAIEHVMGQPAAEPAQPLPPLPPLPPDPIHESQARLQDEVKALADAAAAAEASQLRDLLRRVQTCQAASGVRGQELLPRHACIVSVDAERAKIRALLEQFRKFSAPVQDGALLLLNAIGMLLAAAGDMAAARDTFVFVAHKSPASSALQAPAHFNASRAAMELQDWPASLDQLLKAVSIDPDRYAPFPLQRYEPQRVLGAGGFGVAFLCRDRFLGTDVVVKSLHPGDIDRELDKVFAEARTLRSLHHLGIINVLDCNYADLAHMQRPFIVMEYFQGQTLEALLRECGSLDLPDFLAIARQIAAAIKAAHDGGVLHRDLKPENVLLRKEGARWIVKVIDFGLAIRRQAFTASMLEYSGVRSLIAQSIAGTIRYAPPEQIGEKPGVPHGPYSDVYAFGKMCCMALFQTTEPRSRHWDAIPRDLTEVLEACIDQDLEHRCKSFDVVIEKLERISVSSRPRTVSTSTSTSSTGGAPAKPSTGTAGSTTASAGTPPPAGRKIITTSTGLKLAWIPPGEFMIGSPESEAGRLDNETQHRVTLTKGFHLGIYPVTQEQWKAIMGTDNSTFKGPNLPVVNVSWEQAVEFCRKLSTKEGKTYRLPTEAEWEYACRAGTTTPFHFGATIATTQANFDGSTSYSGGAPGQSRDSTTAVGAFPPSPWGLYDMHGNVWEWCSDFYADFSREEATDPTGPPGASAPSRVLRGGSWQSSARLCRSASRARAVPHVGDYHIGFRVVCEGTAP